MNPLVREVMIESVRQARELSKIVVCLMVFIAFVGVTGFLPVTFVGIIQGIKELSAKMIGFAK